MGRNYSSLLVYLFLNLYEEKFIQNVVQEKKKKLLFWPLTRHLDILMLFYSSTVVYCTPMLTQYIPVCLN